jgi:hypothetical protein
MQASFHQFAIPESFTKETDVDKLVSWMSAVIDDIAKVESKFLDWLMDINFQ